MSETTNADSSPLGVQGFGMTVERRKRRRSGGPEAYLFLRGLGPGKLIQALLSFMSDLEAKLAGEKNLPYASFFQLVSRYFHFSIEENKISIVRLPGL